MDKEFIYIGAIVIFLLLAFFLKKTNETVSKIFTTIGFGAVVLTTTNYSHNLALHFNNPSIATACTVISILFFIFIVIKFWIKTMKIFIIILLISIFAFSPKIINMYHNFESTVTNEMHNIDLEREANNFINKIKTR